MRFFNTVGPRQTGRYGMVIPNFVRQALAGQPITVHGDGTQTRSFCYVRDVVGALLRLVDEPRAVGEVFNVGNSQEISIMALAERVRDAHRQPLARSSRSPTTRPTSPASRTCRAACPTCTKIRALVGYEPRTDLDEILADVIDDFRRQ